MKNFRIAFFLISIFLSTFLTADVKYCYIKDEAKHRINQKLLEVILEREMAACPAQSPEDQAHFLTSRITDIAAALIKAGFLSEAYENPTGDANSYLSFNFFPLWEGKYNSIPLTFFVYAWPSKELALKHNPNDPRNHYYVSPIHSHPIPCAFAVLDGSLLQKNFEVVEGTTVRLASTEWFHKGQGDVDDLNELFIHQMYNPDNSSRPTLSLHAYGLESSEKVMKSFKETASQHTYKGT